MHAQLGKILDKKIQKTKKSNIQFFAPGSSEVAVGFFSLLYLLVQNLL